MLIVCPGQCVLYCVLNKQHALFILKRPDERDSVSERVFFFCYILLCSCFIDNLCADVLMIRTQIDGGATFCIENLIFLRCNFLRVQTSSAVCISFLNSFRWLRFLWLASCYLICILSKCERTHKWENSESQFNTIEFKFTKLYRV